MPEVLEARRNVLRLWLYFAGHHQQGPGEGRATNPQLILGINDPALKNPEGQTLW